MVERLFKVVFTRQSRKKIKEIGEYYEENASKEVSKKVRKEIMKKGRSLERYPEGNPLMPGTEDRKEEIRYTKAWSYKIIYQVLQLKYIVKILTVRHDKEDPDKIIDDL